MKQGWWLPIEQLAPIQTSLVNTDADGLQELRVDQGAGVLQPIIVNKSDAGILLRGERRWRASALAASICAGSCEAVEC